MNQMALGAALPFLALAARYALRRGRGSLRFFCCAPLWLAAGILWATAPDLPRLLGMHELYSRLAQDPRMDLFLFHYSIDRIEGDTFPYHALLVLMAVLLVGAAWRELRQREREQAR
jgi:hypothetical protein